jgi:sporulation protein YlmC with PRC-barrel domain
MRGDEVDLGLRLLDDQLIDAEGRRCGRVDDIELEGGPGTQARVAALLSGAGAWRWRAPRRLAGVFGAVTPPFVHRIPWEDVDDVATTVKLARSAAALGLGTEDGRAVRWVREPVEGTLLVSQLLGARAVTASGEQLGRIRDVRVQRVGAQRPEKVEEPWVLVGLLVGGVLALRQRLGATPEQRRVGGDESPPPPNLVGWERVLEVGDGVVRVAD